MTEMLFVTAKELCVMFRCSRVKLWRMRQDADFPQPVCVAPDVNSRPMWLKADIDAFQAKLSDRPRVRVLQPRVVKREPADQQDQPPAAA